jgi:hypothetical protein
MPDDPRKLTQDELEQATGETLPERAVMSLINPPNGMGPIGVIQPVHPQPEPVMHPDPIIQGQG